MIVKKVISKVGRVFLKVRTVVIIDIREVIREGESGVISEVVSDVIVGVEGEIIGGVVCGIVVLVVILVVVLVVLTIFLILMSFNHFGGFQLEFVSISRIINYMTSYNSSALIG